eukprot:5736049-Amphidinium_carterae.2
MMKHHVISTYPCMSSTCANFLLAISLSRLRVKSPSMSSSIYAERFVPNSGRILRCAFKIVPSPTRATPHQQLTQTASTPLCEHYTFKSETSQVLWLP